MSMDEHGYNEARALSLGKLMTGAAQLNSQCDTEPASNLVPPTLPTHLVESIVAVNSKIDLIKILSRKKVEAQIKCEQLGSMPTPIDGEARIQAVIAFDLARYEYIEANRALEAALQQP